jgi:hypothetical protein
MERRSGITRASFLIGSSALHFLVDPRFRCSHEAVSREAHESGRCQNAVGVPRRDAAGTGLRCHVGPVRRRQPDRRAASNKLIIISA